MALPKNVKKYLPLTPDKILLQRREELLEQIQKDGTYLPKSILHADLDRGMLDFVKEDLGISVSGKKINTIDLIITTQNWAQFTESWNFQDLDKNIKPPFVATVRNPDVKFGTNPSLQYTIPNRKQFYYAKVPTWDGQRKGMDIYKIPQPVPVDITYNVKIFCNKMRHLNDFNRKVLQTFSSRQAYTEIKGHYSEELLEKLFLGSSVSNPIDFLATGTAEQLETIIDYCENHFSEIDAMVVIFGSPGLFKVYDVYDVLHKKMLVCKKPIFPISPSVVNVKKEIDYFILKGNINFPDEVLFGKNIQLRFIYLM